MKVTQHGIINARRRAPNDGDVDGGGRAGAGAARREDCLRAEQERERE